MNKAIFSVFVILLVFFGVSAESQILTFIHEGSGSGTLNGMAFQSSDFVITGTGDTNSRQSFLGSFLINHISASIWIEGLGNFDFVTGTCTFVNNDYSIVGFSRARYLKETGADLFNGPTDTVFDTWDMIGPVGPVNGTGQLLQWCCEFVNDIYTTGGILIFNDEEYIDTTFTAVPEPTTMVLLGLGALMLRKIKD